MADPVFIGYCTRKNVECAAKVVAKAYPEEPVGVVCRKNNRFCVVEYSEFDAKLATKTGGNGVLLFNAANIVNHYYSVEFLERIHEIESEMSFHIAKKKIKHVDIASGNTVSPSSPNGIKLELFIFDVFPYTKSFAVLEVERCEEFSPLKNAPGAGADCPETSRRDIVSQHVRFIENAGGKVEGASADNTNLQFEISPLVSYAGENLQHHVIGRTVKAPALINSVTDLQKRLA